MTTNAARGRIGYWAGVAAALVLGAGASGAESLGLHPDLTWATLSVARDF